MRTLAPYALAGLCVLLALLTLDNFLHIQQMGTPPW